ncbi:hypothetical protein MMC13_005428 [Lambiella insularis]|nr:hypothetical protein [Lambiella insularis]
MKLSSTFIALSALASRLVLAAPIAEPVNDLVARASATQFIVSPPGVSCGSGTLITANPGNKGNFSSGQATIVVTQAAGNCHVSLYTGSNQSGSITERLNTDTTGTCVTTSGTWLSYGYYCD